jgi:hypothetical protein
VLGAEECEKDAPLSRPVQGGLVSYGTKMAEEFQRAAPYVDRIHPGPTADKDRIEIPQRSEALT